MRYDKYSAILDYFANNGESKSIGHLMMRWGWSSKSVVHGFVEGLKNGTENDLRTVNELVELYLKAIKERKKNGKKNDSQTSFLTEDMPRVDHIFSPRFTVAWEEWIAYKKREWKQSYKALKTEQTAVNKLIKDCGGNEQMAIDMIECSMANRWQGIYADNAIKRTYQVYKGKKGKKEIIDTPNPEDTEWTTGTKQSESTD
jgi:hypothetical protein